MGALVPASTSSGGGGAVTIADGADVAEGALADVAVTGDSAGTVSAKLRGILKILTDIWSDANNNFRAELATGLTLYDARQIRLLTSADVVDVSDRVGRLLGVIASITNPVDVSDRAARLLGVVFGSQAQQLKQTAINFNSQVELATGATLYDARQIRLLTSADVVDVSDRVGRLLGVIASITAAVDVSDRAARLLGLIDLESVAAGFSQDLTRQLGVIRGENTDNTANPTTKVSVIPARANAADPAFTENNQAPQSMTLAGYTRVIQRAAILGVTAVAAVNTALTLTLPAPGAGLFHYIISLELVKLYSVLGVAAGAGVTITSTNTPGGATWTTEQLASAAGTAIKVIKEEFPTPFRSSVANTATTFVAPAQLQTIWRWNVRYYTAP